MSLSSSSSSCILLNGYDDGSFLFSVYLIWYDYNGKGKRKKEKIWLENIFLAIKIMWVLCWLWFVILTVYSSSFLLLSIKESSRIIKTMREVPKQFDDKIIFWTNTHRCFASTSCRRRRPHHLSLFDHHHCVAATDFNVNIIFLAKEMSGMYTFSLSLSLSLSLWAISYSYYV